jgi:two-component system chemotaxis sensor kinase CheA
MSGADFDNEMFADLLSDFLDESGQLLGILNERLLEFDGLLQEGTLDAITADTHLDKINEVFRAAHSLKGGSAMLGLTNVNKLTHKLENVLDEVRAGKLSLTRPLVDVVFHSIDRLESMMNRLRDDRDSEISTEDQEFMDWLEAEHASAAQGMIVTLATEQTDDEPSPELIDEIELAGEGIPDAVLPQNDEHEIQTSPGIAEALEPATEEASPAIESPGDDDAFDLSNYMTLYLDEVEEQTDRLNELLLTLEGGNASPETMGEIFRMAHSIKGAAASMGFDEVKDLTHEIESYFDQLRNKTREIDERTINVIFGSLDALRDFHQAMRQGTAEPPSLTSQTARVVAAIHGTPDPMIEATRQAINFDPTPWTSRRPGLRLWIEFEPNLSLISLKGELIVHRLESIGEVIGCQPTLADLDDSPCSGRFVVDIATEAPIDDVQRTADVDGVASIKVESHRADEDRSVPCAEPAPIASALIAPATPTSSSNSKPASVKIDAVAEPVVAPPVAAVASTPTSGSAKSAPAPKSENKPLPASNADSSGKVAETLRVEIDRLDQLMNLAGELVINKARFVQISSGLQELFRGKGAQYAAREIRQRLQAIAQRLDDAKRHGKSGMDSDALYVEINKLAQDFSAVREELDRVQRSRTQFNSLAEAIHQLTRVADGIQKSVMDTRMVPVGPLFSRFKRVVRDVARTANKDVHLDILGEKTELDKRMIDELGDPMVHLVRNAVDHGLETPEERRKAGKPAAGSVRLEAMHRGNCVVVEVADDGRGIDPAKIRRKVLERGLASEAELDQMTEKQILQFIWAAGFSTAQAVTDISGRGVGLDIVRSKIEDLSGTVEVQSEIGKGTVFSIRLPLTLAILPSLLSQVYDEVYAFPLESVEEIVAIPVGEVYTVHGIRTIRVRGRVISLVSLDDVFHWGGASHPKARERKSIEQREVTVVICQSNGSKLGVVVDSLIGEEDIVIKSLAQNYENVIGLAGASILGDGRVSLILDINAISELAQKPKRVPA